MLQYQTKVTRSLQTVSKIPARGNIGLLKLYPVGSDLVFSPCQHLVRKVHRSDQCSPADQPLRILSGTTTNLQYFIERNTGEGNPRCQPSRSRVLLSLVSYCAAQML